MKQRVISSIIMLPLVIFVFLGGVPLLFATALCAAIAMYEFYRGYEALGVKPDKVLGWILLILLFALVYYEVFTQSKALVFSNLLLLWVFITIFVGLIISLIRPDHNILDGPITSLGVFYIAFFFVHVVLIDRLPRYNMLIWLVFLASFGTDIFAYFSGYFFGKHKLCPNISPKKTIEGAIGGVLGSCVLCGIFSIIFFKEILIHCMIIGLVGSGFAMAGDLVASAFKRKMGIKDYGNLIPGHGGILDRFDSVSFVAPFIYYYAVIFIKP